MRIAPLYLSPFFLGEAKSTRSNILSITRFLTGKLVGYLFWGIVAYLFGRSLETLPLYNTLLFGIIFLLLSICMAYSGLSNAQGRCTLKIIQRNFKGPIILKNGMMTVLLGLLTGINFCPPFLLAFSSTASNNDLAHSLFYFFSFYVGTLLYFIPVIFLGALSKEVQIQTIGKMMSSIMAMYFFYKGLLMIMTCLP